LGSAAGGDFFHRFVHVDVAKDGKRFIVNRYVKPEVIAPLPAVLNVGA
jgi:hypothetical protein